jgi:ATP-dependent Lon protease
MTNEKIKPSLESSPSQLPVVHTMDLVAFPGVMLSLYVEDESSKAALDKSVDTSDYVLLLAEKSEEHKGKPNTYLQSFGVVGTVVKKFTKKSKLITCLIEKVDDPDEIELTTESMELIDSVHDNLRLLVEFEHLPEEMLLVTEDAEHPGVIADIVIAHYKLNVEQAQDLLEEADSLERLKKIAAFLEDELKQLHLMEELKDKTHQELTKGQRDYYLREQLKQIQRELGDEVDDSEDVSALEQKLLEAKLPKHAKEESEKQLNRLKRMSAESSEFAMLRTYLEWISDLPWSVKTKDRLDIKIAKEILNKEHYSLEKAKDRILEFLSVRKLKKDSMGPILCFVGPPGVGKTSLGKSIANCLQRKFYRISLGGMRDEAEIRGHRRTYVGALPGKIIQGIKECKSSNPVILLDELDKIGADYRGDPAAALLEILDPEQNKDFRDHYLNITYDLSKCIFIATANTLDTIPQALRDRLEIIRIPGYTSKEKLNIAKEHLIPKEIEKHGLKDQNITFDNAAISLIIDHYTREAGVRNLSREIASVCRKVVRVFVETDKIRKKISDSFVEELLGPKRFESEEREEEALIGLSRGLAWTVFGGEVMPVEVSLARGKGTLSLTGSLGDVMRESAQTALFFARANADELGINPDFYKDTDIHVHVPDGSTPKDGPSAGITIVTAVVSALTLKPVRADIAMTGEVTLRGAVRGIGGLKEKALAALMQGIPKIIIPQANVKDLVDIPKEQREKIEFIPVTHVNEVLEIALVGQAKIGKSKPIRKKKVKATVVV